MRSALISLVVCGLWNCGVDDRSLEVGDASVGAQDGPAGDDTSRPADGAEDRSVDVEDASATDAAPDSDHGVDGAPDANHEVDGTAGDAADASVCPPPLPVTGEVPLMNPSLWRVGVHHQGVGTPTGSFDPQDGQSPPLLSDGTRSYFRLTGSGLGPTDGAALELHPSADDLQPLDLGSFAGFSFDAKGSSANYWVLANTTDVDSRCGCTGTGCNAYAFRLLNVSNTDWTTVTVKWSDFTAAPWSTPTVPMDPHKIISMGVGGVASSIDVAFANLTMVH
jgi:hypothetical protein